MRNIRGVKREKSLDICYFSKDIILKSFIKSEEGEALIVLRKYIDMHEDDFFKEFPELSL